MPTFDVLSGTWYHITAPDLETAEKAYDAYWDVDEPMPEGCKVVEGEVDSHWIPVDLDLPMVNETTYKAMQDAWNGNTTPEPPKGWTPAW
jgi:hypothetical protein